MDIPEGLSIQLPTLIEGVGEIRTLPKTLPDPWLYQKQAPVHGRNQDSSGKKGKTGHSLTRIHRRTNHQLLSEILAIRRTRMGIRRRSTAKKAESNAASGLASTLASHSIEGGIYLIAWIEPIPPRPPAPSKPSILLRNIRREP